MKHLNLILLSTLLVAHSAWADGETTPPEISITSPALGEEADGGTVVVQGSVTDSTNVNTFPAGVERVIYRLQGERRWRNAILSARNSATTDFFFSFKIKKGENKRFYVRAFDLCRNESDTLGRKVFRPRVMRRAAATSTDDTNDDGNDATGTSVSNSSTATSQSVTAGASSSSSATVEIPKALEPDDDQTFNRNRLPTARRTSQATIIISPYFPVYRLDVSDIPADGVAIDPRNGDPFLLP
ncbi:MAG: hypothetical protein AAGA58_01995 [Verrucomicrobiota bacterium]